MKHSALPLTLALLCSLPAFAQEAGVYEVKVSGSLNVRAGPSRSAERVGSLPAGARVQVVAVNGEWARVRLQGGERYVHAGYLEPAQPEIYELEARDSRRGPYRLQLRLLQAGTHVELKRIATYADGSEEVHSGQGERRGGETRARLQERAGATGALQGEPAEGSVELRITHAADGGLRVQDRSPRGEGSAVYQPPAPRAEASQEGRHLLAIATSAIERQLRDRAYRGVDLEREFGVSRYLHLGVGAGIKAIPQGALSPAQRQGSAPGHVWLESRVQGGARVPLSTTIPLGEVRLGLGFEAGARVDYTVVDLYPMPRGVTDVSTVVADLGKAAKRSFDLPLDAAEARRMTVGARRVFNGTGRVAVSGSLVVGRDLGPLGDVLRAGASTRVGGFYRISGRVRIEVERLPGERARLRLTRGKTHTRGASANLLLGLSLDRARVRDELEPAMEYLDEALVDRTELTAEQRRLLLTVGREVAIQGADGIVRKALKVTLQAKLTNTHDREVDLAYVLDLRNARAREAYERAIRGDFTLAGLRATESTSGVTLDHRVLEVERATHLQADLDLSVVFDASLSRRIGFQNLSVLDESGQADYEVWTYEREFATNLFNRERRRNVEIELIRRHLQTGPDERALRFTVEIKDPTTWEHEAQSMQRLMKWWRLDERSDLPRPEAEAFRSRYGATETVIEIEIADAGLRSVLQRSEADLFKAYTYAFATIKGKMPIWATEAGQRRVEAVRGDDRDDFERERRELRAARDFVRHLTRLQRPRDARQRADSLRWLGQSTRFDLYSVAAIVALTPRQSISIDAALKGRRIRVVDGVRGTPALTVSDPR